MLAIKDRLSLQLFINGREFPFDRVNTLDFLHISSSVRLSIPMVHIKIIDAVHWLSKKQDLVDGAVVGIILQVDKETRSYQFRLNTFREVLTSSGISYEIDGYFDTVAYWLLSTKDTLKGTSDFALSEIAKACKIKRYSGTKTADEQLWISKNKQYRHYARDIVDRGYVNDQSCMQLAYDLNGTLIYKNLAEKRRPTALFLTSKYQAKSFIVTDFRVKSQSGLLNSLTGYAEELHVPSTGESETYDTVTANKISTRLMVNTDIDKAIPRNRVTFCPIDSGNTHNNYEKAYYQNLRLSNLFSFGVELVTPDVTDLALLDFISYEAKLGQTENVSPYSGNYYIASKVIYVQGINYYEKFELARQGINTSSSNLT